MKDPPAETIYFAITYGDSEETHFLVFDADNGDVLKDRIVISGPNGDVYSMVRYSDDPLNDR